MKFDETLFKSDDATTRQRVARSILVNGPSTAAALAERLELTPAAVRRHLEQLLEEGVVEARDPRPGAHKGRGRPAKLFALTERGRQGFDQHYDDLALQALRFLAESAGEKGVREFADRRAGFIRARFESVHAAEPGLTPAEVLAQVFTDAGYAASVRGLPLLGDQSVGEQLCQQHCPVSHVAAEFPQLCEAETAAISEVLGTHVQRLATIAHGDGVCTTCIPHGLDTPSPGGSGYSTNDTVVGRVASAASVSRPTDRATPTAHPTNDRKVTS